MSQQTILVGVSGASGAGKSHLARLIRDRLSDELGDVQLLSEDEYYRDQSELTFEQRQTVNYDHPDALEHELLVQQLSQIRSGQSVETPKYDYGLHTRSEITRTLVPPRVLILDGILLFHEPEMRELFDLKIFVETDLDICLERRIQRDKRERDRDLESIIEQYETTVRPMYEQFTKPTRQFADLVVDGRQDSEAEIAEIIGRVRKLALAGDCS